MLPWKHTAVNSRNTKLVRPKEMSGTVLDGDMFDRTEQSHRAQSLLPTEPQRIACAAGVDSRAACSIALEVESNSTH